MRAWTFTPLFVSLLLGAACSDEEVDPTDGEGAGDAGAGGTGGAGGAEPLPHPSIHFFVDERPHDSTDAEIETDTALWGDPIRVEVRGLLEGRRVRVETSLGSWAVFTAAADEKVDLGRDLPVEGTWARADADGMIWSAPPGDLEFDFDVTVTDADTAEPLVSGSFSRKPVNTDVEATEVADGTRVGTLVRPSTPSATKRPAILAFGGSEGGTGSGEFFAYYLAQLGYVSFGVGYFAAPGVPAQLEQVPLEILEDDLAFLASQPDVDPERIAVLGGSRGGELALLLGATFPDVVSAVVAQVPSGYVWGATSGDPVSAWSKGGTDLPFVPSSGGLPHTYQKDGETYYLSTPSFHEDIEAATPEELDAATTRIELASGPVLFLAGANDNLWPSCDLAQVAFDRLMASGHVDEHGDEMHCFPDGGHFIVFPPGQSTLDSTAYFHPTYDVWFDVGGTPEGNAAAERAGNTALRAFLERALGR